MSLAERVKEQARLKNSVLVVGLDPDIRKFPDYLIKGYSGSQQVEEALYRFNRTVIDAVQPYAVAVKPQLAFYEIFGSYGIRALERTITYAGEKDLLVIGDAKRNDVGFVADAYAQAYLGNGPLGVDAVTVNPFLGTDGIYPFAYKAVRENKGVFIILKTSNPSSGEIQNLVTDNGQLVYEKVAEKIEEVMASSGCEAENYSCLGVVVGATYPEDARKIRRLLPRCIFLVPGFGAQGAEAESLKGCFDGDGFGALVNSSRSIIYSYTQEKAKGEVSEDEVFQSISEAAKTARQQLNRIRFQ